VKYRVVALDECREIVRERLQQDDDRSIQGTEQGMGPEVDWQQVDAAAEEMTALCSRLVPGDKDAIEGRMAVVLHRALAHVDHEVLDDDGFWRYLGLKYFWKVICWRQPEALGGKGSPTTALDYVDATKPTDCVLTRMYLRAVAVGLEDEPQAVSDEAAHILPKAADFWRSHILRVRTATAPPLVQAMVAMQRDDRMATTELRRFAKRVNRTWTNVVLNVYDQDEASALLSDLRTGLQPEGEVE